MKLMDMRNGKGFDEGVGEKVQGLTGADRPAVARRRRHDVRETVRERPGLAIRSHLHGPPAARVVGIEIEVAVAVGIVVDGVADPDRVAAGARADSVTRSPAPR